MSIDKHRNGLWSACLAILFGCGGELDLIWNRGINGDNGNGSGGASGGFGACIPTHGGMGSYCYGALKLVPAAGASYRGWGGNGPLPPLPGWLIYGAQEPNQGSGLYLSRADSREHVGLTEPEMKEKHPSFSPAEQRIAYASNRSGTYQIEVRELATGERRKLTQEYPSATFPVWSPNGLRIAYVIGDDEETWEPAAPTGVKVVDVASGELVRAIDSARSSHLAFVDDDRLLVTDSRGVFSVSLSTNERREIIPPRDIGFILRISVSSDGQKFVMSAQCEAEAALYVLPLEPRTEDPCDPAARVSPDGAPFYEPAWGPYGYIAARRYDTGGGTIVMLREDGSREVVGVLSRVTGAPSHPQWANPAFWTTGP